MYSNNRYGGYDQNGDKNNRYGDYDQYEGETDQYGGEAMLHQIYQKASAYHDRIKQYMDNNPEQYGGTVNSENFKYTVQFANKLKENKNYQLQHAQYVKLADMILKRAKANLGQTELNDKVKKEADRLAENELDKFVELWKQIPPKVRKSKKSKKEKKEKKSKSKTNRIPGSELKSLRDKFNKNPDLNANRNRRNNKSTANQFMGGASFDNYLEKLGDRAGTFY